MVGQERFQDINKALNARLAEKKVLIAVHRGSWGGSIIENTTAHFGAQSTGIIFFTDVKDNLTDMGFLNGIGHLQLLTKVSDRGEVHLFITQIQCHSLQFKRGG